MRWLERKGYQAVTLAAVRAAWDGRIGMPERPVVISFDDGLRGQYDRAFPKLAKRGWPGVLNLKLEAIESGELTEEMVREMVDAGWELDSHTITHADVATLSGAPLRREVAGSRKRLQEMFGVPVDYFCYPAGSYDDEAVAAVEDAGYSGATTTEEGLAGSGDDPFTLPRVRIDGSDGVAGLAAKLG
jgi:peptidoglycan/xylan/chitin deacetylase (PgdA/CDA1 family)